MKVTVRMKTRYAGPSGNIAPGDTKVCEESEAQALIDGGFAERVGPAAKPAAKVEPEAATKEPDETAAKPAAKARKGGGK